MQPAQKKKKTKKQKKKTIFTGERECMTESRYHQAKIIHIGRLMDANNCASCRIGITKRSIIKIVPIENNLSFLSIF